MEFLKKYWYLLVVTVITIAIGLVAYLTSTKLQQQETVAPTVPQATPEATDARCKLVFSITPNTPTPTPTGQITKTPTPTRTPTPTGRPTRTPTPTNPPENEQPICVDLTVEPTSGTPPYTVTLTCTGRDNDGQITAAEFTMPDGSTKLVEENVGSPGSITTTYTVTDNGHQNFSCQIRDNSGVWRSSDNCRVNIKGPTPTTPDIAEGPTSTPAPIPTPKVPVAGVPSIVGASTVALGVIVLLLGFIF